MKNIRIHKVKFMIAIFLILACALFLRVYNLNKYDLWFDEQGTDMFSSRNLIGAADLSGVSTSSLMLRNMKNDPHSSLYYLLVYLYSVVFGDGKSLRVLSVIFSMLSLGVFYKLSNTLFTRRVSLYALMIMAVNPFHLWYAQEARAYATACFFALLMIYIYVQALKKDKLFYWICFSITSILAICLSYYSGLLLIISGAALFFKEYRRYIEKWYLSVCATLVFLLLLQYVLIDQLSFVKDNFWLPPPSLTTVLFTWRIFSLGYSATGILYQIGLPVFFLFFGYGAYSYFRSDKAKASVFLLFLFLPIMITYILSKLMAPVYIHRQLIIFSPIYYLFIAKGIESIRGKYVQGLAILCVMILSAASLVNYHRGIMFTHENRGDLFLGAIPRRNYGDLMEHMDRELRKGDLIATADIESYRMAFLHVIKKYKLHEHDLSKSFCFLSYPIKLQPFDVQYLQIGDLIGGLPLEGWEKLQVFSFFESGKVEMGKIQLNAGNFERIWLISSKWEENAPFANNVASVRDYMDQEFRKVSSRERDGIYIDLYIQKTR
ncbi:MAG: glycosyltransferase family 39 protein [Candidatus Omnitrophica bacterium]|nr:glycosyltransferase family 39 protein [Candidatus Omnitrophota bacterium]